MRVFQGINGQAGQPAALAKALRKIGVEARSHCSHLNKFNYGSDRVVNLQKLQDPQFFKEYFIELLENYDIFHFHASTFFPCDRGRFPCLQDLVLLKQAGKKIVFHFRGSEARIASQSIIKNPHHFFNLKDEKIEMLKFTRPESFQVKYIESICAISDQVYANDQEIQSYIPGAKVIPRVFDSSSVVNPRKEKLFENSRVVVVHAPSKRVIKGSEYVLSAVKKLQKKGVEFDFQLVESCTHEEALKIYQKADIIIDQLRIGWYGVLTVEAMSMSKPVMCYIREDLLPSLSDKLPLVPTSIEKIEADLEDLILDKGKQKTIGLRAFEYFKKTHEAEVVAKTLKDDYYSLLKEPSAQLSKSQVIALVEFYAHQYTEEIRCNKMLIKRLVNIVVRFFEMYKGLPFKTFLKQLGRRVGLVG